MRLIEDAGGRGELVALVPRDHRRPPNNLPAELTSFVGREPELEQLQAALGETRLLTLTGAGGAGKTRLASRLAARQLELERFPGGAWWADLAPVADPRLVGEVLAAGLGVRPLPTMTVLEATCARLAGSRALVVLDNCEHMVGACAELTEALLSACPRVTVIATGRAPLGLAGETEWRVPSLTLPAGEPDHETREELRGSDAARLFVERALKARRDFGVTDVNAPAIARICRELDGLPLAIELAAARVRMLSAEQIAARLSDRFRLLTSGTATALPRQQTLRASVDWSHELLDASERALLRRLAVFTGGFTLDLAEAACAGAPVERGAVLDLVASLVDQSLILAEESGAVVRYRMLETVRQYALERLEQAGEASTMADRHRDAMLTLAERIAPELHGPEQREWLKTLDAEAANLAAALGRAADTDAERALRLCVALTFWWKARGLFAAADRGFERALDAGDPGASALRAHALWGRAYLAAYGGRYESALTDLRETCDLAVTAGDRSALARALMMLGFLQIFPDPLGGRATSIRARDLARDCGDDWALITSEINVAFSHINRHELSDGERLLDAILPLSERLGYLELQAWHWLGHCYRPWAAADRASLNACATRALDFARAAGEPSTAALAHGFLAHLEVACGEPAAAVRRMQATHERVVAAGAGLALGWTVNWLAFALASTGELARARAILEPTIATGMDGGFLLANGTGVLAEILRADGDPAAAETRAGEALALAERIGAPIVAASAKDTLGRVLAGRAEWARAEALLHEALSVRIKHDLLLYMPQSFDALAEVAAGLDSREEAARTLGIADRLRADLGLARWGPDEPRFARLEDAVRTALGDDAYELAHRQGNELPLDHAVPWIRGARGQRNRPARGWESLTPTELRVTQLIAQGLTNPQIADRMFISRTTVKTHVSHIFTKLDVTTRAELAAEAARRAAAQA